MPFIDKPDFSRDLTTFMMPFISSFEIVNVVTSDQNVLFWIAGSVLDTSALNPHDIKTL